MKFNKDVYSKLYWATHQAGKIHPRGELRDKEIEKALNKTNEYLRYCGIVPNYLANPHREV